MAPHVFLFYVPFLHVVVCAVVFVLLFIRVLCSYFIHCFRLRYFPDPPFLYLEVHALSLIFFFLWGVLLVAIIAMFLSL